MKTPIVDSVRRGSTAGQEQELNATPLRRAGGRRAAFPQSLLRYPGGKSKNRKDLVGRILEHFYDGVDREYREPFVGGASVGLAVLSDPRVRSAWLNDQDPAIAALWRAVQTQPDDLCSQIRSFVPTAGEFYRLKHYFLTTSIEDLRRVDPVELGLAKLAIHRTSFSGLGPMAGAPQGGRNGGEKIGERWMPDELCRRVVRLHRLMSEKDLRITSMDFSELVASPGRCAMFLDPPYYGMGNGLYLHGLTDDDHVRLAQGLKRSAEPWLLTYDDHPRVRELYPFARIELIQVRHSLIRSSKRQELLISSM